MGRTPQQRRREREYKLTNRRRLEVERHREAELASLRQEVRAHGLDAVTFTIHHDPMPDPLMDALPKADLAEIKRRGGDLLGNPLAHKAFIDGLIERHPHVPTFWNWRMNCHGRAGDIASADRLAEEMFDTFPDYLFGIAQWITTLVQRGRIDEATRALRGRLGLTAWWPHRRDYHATEFVAFNAALGCYFAAIGNIPAARDHLDMIAEVLPDHPGVRVLERMILVAAVRGLGDDIAAGPPLPEVETPSKQVADAAGW